MKINIDDVETVWIVWGNTDLTEGRGDGYPLHLCERKSTAIRLSKKAYVQGTDAPVEEGKIYCIKGRWYGVTSTVIPTREDIELEKERIEREGIIEKAKQLGLSDVEIEKLSKL